MPRDKRGGSAGSSGVVGERGVQAFFREQVTSVLERQRLSLDESTEFYLVNMLSEFVRSEQLFEEFEDGRLDSVPLAFLLMRAMEQPRDERLRTFKKLGDTSLYVSGFFSDSLERSLVDIDYYMEMGGRAYGSAAELVEPGRAAGRVFRRVFCELAEKFRRVVDCLMEMSEESQTTRPGNLVRLYERWLHTRSERLARRLADQGIFPNEPGHSKKEPH